MVTTVGSCTVNNCDAPVLFRANNRICLHEAAVLTQGKDYTHLRQVSKIRNLLNDFNSSYSSKNNVIKPVLMTPLFSEIKAFVKNNSSVRLIILLKITRNVLFFVKEHPEYSYMYLYERYNPLFIYDTERYPHDGVFFLKDYPQIKCYPYHLRRGFLFIQIGRFLDSLNAANSRNKGGIKKQDRFNGRTLTIFKAEGSYVKHRLFLKGVTLAKVGETLSVGANTVSNVLNGRRMSKKIETGIARLLGHECWDDVVADF